jgi:hypothetical protein
MKSGKFLKYFSVITILLIVGFVALNIYIDIYGLFLGRTNRKVYVNERTSKYLLSYRYIPENYDAIIVGPSLSANLNPSYIRNYNAYNASVMGANISELKYLLDNVLERGNLKLVVICLDPYLTKDFGKKSASIDPKEYYGALGSTNLLKTYLMYAVRHYELLPNKYAKDIITQNGWNNFGLEMKGLDANKIIAEKIEQRRYEAPKFDNRAYEELRGVIEKLKSKDVKIVAYFTPIPYPLYSIGRKDYEFFEEHMKKLFSKEDIVINLNSEKYKTTTSDYSIFIDHGHLSASGQKFVLDEINAHIENTVTTTSVPVRNAITR